jgi:uncharacterized membrane protein
MAIESRETAGGPRSSAVKDVVRGKRFRRPTHPIFVMFPIAFFCGTLALDVLSKIGLDGAARAATLSVTAGLIGAAFAIPTGLVDRSLMRPGSRIRRVATRHMLIQLTATGIFLVDRLVRLGSSPKEHAAILWIVLDVLGTAVVIVGGDVGGQMVFRMGYRVGEGGDRAGAPSGAQPVPLGESGTTGSAPAS